MDRRRFLQTVAATTADLAALATPSQAAETVKQHAEAAVASAVGMLPSARVDTQGHTKLCTFRRGKETWVLYEDLRTRDGVVTFVGADGSGRVLRKTAEAAFAGDAPQHLGLDIKEIGLGAPDLLADKLLASGGDPEEASVRVAAPPMNSAAPPKNDPNYRPGWDTIVGTSECSDTMPVYPSGSTRTYHPVQYFHEISGDRVAKRHDGLLGGWMPGVRKVFPDGSKGYYEVVVFGDVLAKDRFIVQTWHRTSHVEDGVVTKVEFGYSYPAYTRRRQDPSAEEFYRGMLEFAEYWERRMQDVVPISLPDQSWVDMTRYAFVKEQMVRPGGTYPKYGAVDRDYYGPEYDGFQDIFTMSLTANLELGRFDLARQVFDKYFTSFVDAKGMINMRGAETAQFGLTLWLIARFFNFTGDESPILKHREKIEQTAMLLEELHDESLKLPETNRGYGLIWGWNESDSCLMPNPSIWNKPYFANAAMTVRGWRELARLWRRLKLKGGEGKAEEWDRRSKQLEARLVAALEKSTRRELKPPYIGPLPGTTMRFREAMAKEQPSEQGWPHRAYAELVHADVLPDEMSNRVIDCMRAYGATTLGVVANVGRPEPDDRALLGFISYGYAQQLLRLDRIEEYILFLYSHRYHDHSRGSWTAGEVSGIAGGGAIFCIPAQQTIPILVKWMLVFEEPDRDVLHVGRAVPREWVASGKPISIAQAPTRWGRVDYTLVAEGGRARARVVLQKGAAPEELHVRFRVPVGKTPSRVTVNGQPAQLTGRKGDTVVITVKGSERQFDVVTEFG